MSSKKRSLKPVALAVRSIIPLIPSVKVKPIKPPIIVGHPNRPQKQSDSDEDDDTTQNKATSTTTTNQQSLKKISVIYDTY